MPRRKSKKKTLVVFGQGPLIDPDTREKAETAKTPRLRVTMNFWGWWLALAASIPYRMKVVTEIIVLGGRTGGKAPEGGEYASEAEILRNQMVKFGVPRRAIKLEMTSTNTLENLINFINLYLTEDPEREFFFLGTPYHIPRIRILAWLFNIRYRFIFSSREVVRAMEYQKPDFWASPVLSEIERMLDLNTVRREEGMTVGGYAVRNYYQDQKGTERDKDFWIRFMEEDAFTRLLMEVVTNAAPYPARIKDDALYKGVLRNFEWLFPGYLEFIGVDSSATDPDELNRGRVILAAVKRPDIAKFIKEEWPKGSPVETRAKLEYVVNLRRKYERGLAA